jgi:predicted CXXCH cytochrome family protein
MLSSQPEPGSPYLKSLPPWEELDYHRRPRPLRSRRFWVTLCCSGLAVLFAAWSWLPGKRRAHEAAPVSLAHAPFNQDCSRCHVEHFQPALRLFEGDGVRSVSDTTCERCHDGPLHNPQQVRTPACSTCHREHEGKPFLAQVADGFCTDCHANLQRKDGERPWADHITAFAVDHPEFRAVQPGSTDPSRLRFNHKFHLELDLKALRDRGRPVDDRYGDKLECGVCHQPEADRRYMQPIKYEEHCKQCHPLSVQLAGKFTDAATERAAEEFRKVPAPHDEPAIVRAVLRDRLVDFARKHPVVAGTAAPSPPPERAIPGRDPRPPTEQEWVWSKQQLKAAEELLFIQKELSPLEQRLFQSGANCTHCHYMKGTDSDGLPQYERTEVPERWFRKSVFRHDSHRMLQCVQCHGQALTSERTSDVLLPNQQSCVQCHQPGLARSDCVECHVYHDRSRQQSFNGPLTVEEFLPAR